ncbi:hypothetical protein [Streptomyces natalensis]|nr:hypothetical protein [Streptomyces natalensis]
MTAPIGALGHSLGAAGAIEAAVSRSFGFGGHTAVLAFRRP